MPHPSVPPVRYLGVNAVELAHPLGQISLRRLNDQMVVVPHQTIRMAYPTEALDDLTENFEVRKPILIVFVDRLLAVAPRCHMIQRTSKLNPQRSGHRQSLAHKMLSYDSAEKPSYAFFLFGLGRWRV